MSKRNRVARQKYRVGGTRGGAALFNWDDVKVDKHRQNYLGFSLKAKVGRAHNVHDSQWYMKSKQNETSALEEEKAMLRMNEQRLRDDGEVVVGAEWDHKRVDKRTALEALANSKKNQVTSQSLYFLNSEISKNTDGKNASSSTKANADSKVQTSTLSTNISTMTSPSKVQCSASDMNNNLSDEESPRQKKRQKREKKERKKNKKEKKKKKKLEKKEHKKLKKALEIIERAKASQIQ